MTCSGLEKCGVNKKSVIGETSKSKSASRITASRFSISSSFSQIHYSLLSHSVGARNPSIHSSFSFHFHLMIIRPSLQTQLGQMQIKNEHSLYSSFSHITLPDDLANRLTDDLIRKHDHFTATVIFLIYPFNCLELDCFLFKKQMNTQFF